MNKFIDVISNTDRVPIFLDVNNLLYRYYYVYTPEKFKSVSGTPNGHLFGLTNLLSILYKLNYVVFMCEDSKDNWRKTLNENYKGTRNHEVRFLDIFSEIRCLISNLPNTYTIAIPGREADDLMYSAAKECSKRGIKCSILTMDKDLMQTLDENISILQKVTLSKKEEICYNSSEYYEKFPVEPCKLALYRSFKGDISDNLPIPVPRLPKDLLLDLVDFLYENESMSNYQIKKKSHEKWVKELANNWNTFITNYKIMKLSSVDFDILDKEKFNSYLDVVNKYDLFQYGNFIQSL